MRLLLDTHIYLWVLANDARLSKAARERLFAADEIMVSSASILEASIKAGLGKLAVDIELLVSGIADSGFTELPIRAAHAAMVRDLPDLHRDPFDRILIAQAQSEPLNFLTADHQLAAYSPLVVKV
jgi:PIN domain nuclease of toxin-antitoxin system